MTGNGLTTETPT